MLPPWLIALLFVLAVHRASRFIGQDTFPPVAWIRWRLVRRHLEVTTPPWGGDQGRIHWLRYLIGDNVNTGCPWCISLWLAGGGAVGVHYAAHWPWWTVALLGLAASTVTGLIAQLED